MARSVAHLGVAPTTFVAELDWLLREGWDVLVRAYVEEFAEADDVSLVLRPRSSLGFTPAQITESLTWYLRSIGHDPEQIPDLLLDFSAVLEPRGQVEPSELSGSGPRTYAVLATRGERDDAAVARASARGLPLILPTHTGPRPVSEAAAREEPGLVGSMWWEPDVADLRRRMREATSCAPPAHLPALPRLTRAGGAREAVSTDVLSIVVQGQVERRATERCLESIRTHFPGAEVILSTWSGTPLDGLDVDQGVTSEDPGPVGPFDFNINRLITSSLAGIRRASRPLVLKIRSDLVFHSSSLLAYWDCWPRHVEELLLFGSRVLIPNIFARRPSYLAPFAMHPSDWACFGTREDVETLFDVPPMTGAEFVQRSPPGTLAGWFWEEETCMPCGPEQWLWVSAMQKVAPDLRLDHHWDLDVELLRVTELSIANNLAILDAYTQFGVSCPKYPTANRRFEDATLFQHADWLELYDTYCGGSAQPDPQERWERLLAASAADAPSLRRDDTTGGSGRRDNDLELGRLAAADLARPGSPDSPPPGGLLLDQHVLLDEQPLAAADVGTRILNRVPSS